MASIPNKKTECVKVCMDERLFIDLNRLAILDDRKLSEYVHLVLWRHAYGNSNRLPPESEVPERD